MNLKQEKFLFYNDLVEYQVSNEGKEVDNAFKSGNLQRIEKALGNYYYHRNCLNEFTYSDNKELENAKNTDKMILENYKENN